MDGALPREAEVVVVGGGVAGVSTAYHLARAGVPAVLCEKGRIAGEQSSRNWGWIRKQRRDPRELPAAILALRLWEQIAREVGEEIGWRRAGIAHLAETEAQLAEHEAWLAHARDHRLDTRLLSPAEVDGLLGQEKRRFKGGLLTPSDARAEPALAVPALARAAARAGAVVLERCAVRSLEIAAGRVSGAITEHGAIRCRVAVLAGGIWSAPMLRHLGLDLPQLGVVASVLRTAPLPPVTGSAVWAPEVAFRPRLDGGYTVARGGASTVHLTPAALRHARAFLPTLRQQWGSLRLRLGRPFVEALATPRRWAVDRPTPFERMRVLDPTPDHRLLDRLLTEAAAQVPALRGAREVERWAGMIDVTPDEIPVLGPADGLDGLLVATGFSGHGFGLGPAAGYLIAQLAQGGTPRVDLHPFRFSRFTRRKSPLAVARR